MSYETTHLGIRPEFLSSLRIDDLKALCSNRHIVFEVPTNKKALIDSILASTAPIDDYARFTKTDLSIELQAKGVAHSDGAKKDELTRLLKRNRTKKPNGATLSNLKVAELHRLCHHRRIETKSVSSKERYIQLLTANEAPDPEWDDSWTSRQLSAELRARGLTGKLKKEEMISLLDSGIVYEEQQLEAHLNEQNVNRTMASLEKAIDGLVGYMQGHSEEIRVNIKENAKRQRDGPLGWAKMEETLRSARDEVIGMSSGVLIGCAAR